MERNMRLSKAAVVIVAVALVAAIAAAVWFAHPDAPYVPSADSGAALGTAAPAEDGYAEHETTVPSGYTGVYSEADFNNEVRGGSGNFILMKDITLTTLETSSSFSGILDGNGHKITINAGARALGEGDSGGLFATLTSGDVTIRDLTIVVEAFSVATNTNGSAGIIAAWVNSNVTIDNVFVELQYSPSVMNIGGNDNGNITDSGNINDGKANSYLFSRSQVNNLWLGGIIAKVEGENNTVNIQNSTVCNNTAGDYGFAANIWTGDGDFITHNDSFTRVGGFVGAVVKGTLNITNCKYEGEGKMTVIAESTNSYRFNAARIGGAVGQVEGGTLNVKGFIFEGRGTRDSLFGTAGSYNTNYSDVSGRGLIIGKGNPSTLTNLYINGETDPGHGFSNNDGATHDSKLIGDNTYWGGMLQYQSEFIDAEFDGSNVVFAVGKKEPTASDIVYQVKLRETATDKDYTGIDQSTFTVSDSEIADSIAQDSDEIGQAAWITLGTITRNNASYDYELTVSSRVAQSTYNVQNYDTVSSTDDSAYLGSKVYDGNTVATPTLDVGGTTINAWSAPSDLTNVGDGSAKVFTYDQSQLSGYTPVEYNGAVYLVNGTTVYSPGNIIVNGVAQTFVLGKNFSYTIAPMSVTVTPSVPTTQLYEGGEMPELTVTSTVPADIEGTIAWDEGQTLSADVTTYYWTWTPTSSNYKTVNGSVTLTVFEKEITAIEVTTQPDKLNYVAYEPFDPTGVVVTATYSDGTSAALVNDEYKFTVVNGDKNRLVVGNDTVTVSLKKGSDASTKISIFVSKLAVGIPSAIQGLEYNGSEQTGVASSADGYYTLSGHNGTDADDYTATATLADTTNTRWNNEMADDTTPKEIEWRIAKKNVAITGGHTDKTYDGQEVDPSTLFTPPEGVDGQPLDLEIVVADNKTILNADAYSVTARLASTETNYAAEEVEIDYTIETIKVSGNIVFTSDNIYDGTAKTAVFTLDDPSALIGGDQVTITYLEEDRTNVTGEEITAIAVLPSHNYDWADGTSMATLTIVPKKVEIESIQEITKTYDGNTVDPKTLFIAPNGVDGQPIELTVTVDGGKTILNADTYTVTASIAESVTNYTAEDKTITYTIDKKGIEKPIDSVNPYTYNGTEQGFDIAGNADYTVTGVTNATDADDYTFTIALTDKDNTEWANGANDDITVSWSIMKMTIAGAVSAPADLSYDGNAKKATFTKTSGELFGEDAITISYNDGADTVNVTKQTITATASLPNDNYTWSEDSVLSASYEIEPMTVTIGRVHEDVYVDKYYDGEEVDPKTLFTAPNGADGQPLELEFTVDKQAIDGDKTILGVGTYNVTAKLAAGQDNYTADAIEVVYRIYKKNIEIPYDDNATTFEYTGTEQGFTIEESDYYTVTGVTNATDAGEYSFTIALTDKDNTEWANGANDDITVSWSITQATFKTVTPQFEEGAFDDLFTSDPLPMPTQVITDPAGVDGTFTWQDQQLIAGEKVYIWRFTAPNYGIYSGEKTITVSQAQLDHIEVSEVKTEYTAYDAFDKEGMIVTAYYNHGGDTLDPVQLTSGYTISVKDGGDIDKLSVKDVAVIVTYTDGEVTDTAEIAITVNKLLIDIPTAATDLVYNGSEQTGVAESADNYYAISGNVGTNADTYTATAMLIDTDNTEWKSGSTDNITITWSIAPMTVSGEIVADDLVYDGTEKSATFNGQLIGEDTVEIKYVGERVDVTEDGFTVSVTLPSDGGQNYRFENGGQELTKTFKIEPKKIFLGQGNYTWGWIYGDSPVVADLGGNTNDETSFVRAYEDDGLTTPLDQGVNFSAEEKNNDLAQLVNAGEYTLVFTIVTGNYWAEPYEVTVSVAKKAVAAAAVTITAPNTIYTGEEINAEVSVSVELVGDDKITIEYNSVDRVNVTGEEIIATAKLTDNYEWRSDDGIPQEAPSVTYTIQKADVIVDTSSISDGEWSTASDMPELIAEDSQGNAIPGEFVWTPDKLSADIQDYAWVFTPDDGNNYNGTSGNVILNVAQAILESITVGIVTETEYESNDAFDRNDIVVTAIYDGGYVKIIDNEDYVLEFSSGSEYELQTGVITVTVSYTDGETKSATFEIVVAQEVTIEQVKEAINAMDKVTWQNASEYLDLKKRYNALDDADKDVETSAKLAALQTQYDALRDAAIDDIEGAHEVTAKAVGRALAVAAGLAAAAVAAAIAKRRFI